MKTVPKWHSFRSPAAKSTNILKSQKRNAPTPDEGSEPNCESVRPMGNKKGKKLFAMEGDISQSIAELQRESKAMALANMKKAQALEDQTHMALFSMDESTLPDESSRMYFRIRKQQILAKLMSSDLPAVEQPYEAAPAPL